MSEFEKDLNLPDRVAQFLEAGPEAHATQVALARLNQRLAASLPPIIHYGRIANTRIGEVWVAASAEGLFRVDFDIEEEGLKIDLSQKGRFRPLYAPEQISSYLTAVAEYLRGERTRLDLPVDLRALTPFQRSVLLAARAVPRGQVATYAEIAQRVGKPRAFRAVGQALRHNPIPIVLPCHRVISSDGTLGGYGGALGSQRKIELLKLEGVILG